jgi:hypothetical protein
MLECYLWNSLVLMTFFLTLLQIQLKVLYVLCKELQNCYQFYDEISINLWKLITFLCYRYVLEQMAPSLSGSFSPMLDVSPFQKKTTP